MVTRREPIEQVRAKQRERYPRRKARMIEEGTFAEFAMKNRIRCQSYRQRVKEMISQTLPIPFDKGSEEMNDTPPVPLDEWVESPPVPFDEEVKTPLVPFDEWFEEMEDDTPAVPLDEWVESPPVPFDEWFEGMKDNTPPVLFDEWFGGLEAEADPMWSTNECNDVLEEESLQALVNKL